MLHPTSSRTAHTARTAASAVAAALFAALLPALAQAQPPAEPRYELRRPVPGLLVGAPAAPTLSVSTSSVDFGAVATHTTERRQVLVSNSGTGQLSFTAAPRVSGAEAFAAGQTSCGTALGAGQSCVAEVTFSPTQVGSFAGALALEALAAGSPQNVALWGSAFNPVSLGAATLPAGRLGRAYGPFDFRTLLSVSNESTPDLTLVSWQVTAGALPAGLSLDAATGVLSGTPTQLTAGQDLTVAATYRNNQGQQVFTIRVGEAVLEAVQVSAGGSHTCAITPVGAVKCWGRNAEGQLGDGTTTQRLTPVQVVGLASGVASVSAGASHTCAVTAGGRALCWGWNDGGRLGDGTTTIRPAPVTVSGLDAGVASVSAGHNYTCALITGGALRCWGRNGSGQLGDGTTADRLTPVTVSGLGSGVASVSAGAHHTCALITGGALRCWGWNGNGQLGDGTTADRHTPVTVSGLASGVASVSAGGAHTCAVSTGGALRCWGANGHGQLGNGGTLQSTTPVTVSGLGSGVASVSAGSHHTCALITGGALRCWGWNGGGQLGNGTTTNLSTPAPVSGLGAGVAGISAGWSHTCAVSIGGALRCWGTNSNGRLGDGTLTDRSTPVPVLD